MLNWSEIEARIDEGMRAAVVPGLALAVIADGEVVEARAYGRTSDTPDAPRVTPETVFRIGSVTKSLTAALVMRLAEAGVVDLDTPLIEYVPWLKLHDASAASLITLRMLLSHTSGLPAALEYIGWREASGLEAHVRTIVPTLPLVAPPGAVYAYSNPGYNLAGYVAEAAAGVPYADLMQREVFCPLGMTRTTFDPLLAMTWPMSQSFVLDNDGKAVVKRPFVDNTGEYPCGFAMSTVLDLAKIVQMHLRDGCSNGARFLSAESVAAMRTPHADQHTLDRRTYGLGLRQRHANGMRLVGHNGAISKYGAFTWWQPDSGAGVVMLVNRNANFWGAGDRVVLSVLEALTPNPSPSERGEQRKEPTVIEASDVGKIDFDAYVGAYLGPNVGLAVLSVADGVPSLRLNDVEVTLEPAYGRVYRGTRVDGGTLPVGFAGMPDALVLYVDGSACLRLGETLPEAPTEIWAERVGQYAGEIDVWRLRLDSGQMYLYSEDERMEFPAMPLDEHRIVCDFGVFEYLEGDKPVLMGGGGLWRFYRQTDAP